MPVNEDAATERLNKRSNKRPSPRLRKSLSTLQGNDVPPSRRPSTPEDEPKVTDEVGGPEGPEPTRYGDWERKGRCIDF